MITEIRHIGLMGLVMLLVIACNNKPENPVRSDRLPEIYPDYIGVTIPADIAPLNFNMSDEAIEQVDVMVKGSKSGELHSNGEWAEFDIDEWHTLTKQNIGGKLTVEEIAEYSGLTLEDVQELAKEVQAPV